MFQSRRAMRTSGPIYIRRTGQSWRWAWRELLAQPDRRDWQAQQGLLERPEPLERRVSPGQWERRVSKGRSVCRDLRVQQAHKALRA